MTIVIYQYNNNYFENMNGYTHDDDDNHCTYIDQQRLLTRPYKRRLPHSFQMKNKYVSILVFLPLYLLLIIQEKKQPPMILFVHGIPSQGSPQKSGNNGVATTLQKSSPLSSSLSPSSLANDSVAHEAHEEKTSSLAKRPGTSSTSGTTTTTTGSSTTPKSSLVQVYEHEHFSKSTQSWVGGSSPQSTDRWTSSPTNHGSGVKVLPPPSELLAPKGYEYTGDWKIDVTCSISTLHGSGSGSGSTGGGSSSVSHSNISKDELGWEYFISNGVGRRRRRWLRTVVEVHSTNASSSLSSLASLNAASSSKSIGVLGKQSATLSRQDKKHSRSSTSRSLFLDPLDLPGYHFSKRLAKELSDSFNFKGFGMTGSKSLITKGIGLSCRLPLSANFDFWESRPFLPLVNCSLVMYYPLRIAFVLNASLPMGLFKAIFWSGLDWILWLGMTVYCVVWKTLITDLVWKIILWNSIKVMGKILALGPEEDESEYFEYGNDRDDGDYHQKIDAGKSDKELHGGESLFEDDGDDYRIDAKKKMQDEKRAMRFLGREYPSIPRRRSIIYSRAISERLGVNVGMHLSKARGFEVRYAWWHSYLPTVDYLNSKMDSIKCFMTKTQKASKLKKGAVARLLGGKVASLGLVWGGFSPEPPHYSCSSMFSISGLYPGDALRRFREIQAERRSRQLIEKQLDSRLKSKSESLSNEEYEEVIEVKIGAK
mmetsp:Transcript_759/g.1301  ORF Transcript_759/g.1301 Transcript_759/m.1301 type:complete len:709 (+) Transcript_759:407-2533(+)|eukprot:CAMPEP_0176480324 /NCGR_PEP_ID=MMETSP0200_2-20121128/2217_1 /TAXON_ID=947934 /ORGANISM="Chaetoceros sp., Strain GSL56" /LENGTH=708 /DNA_ID=CAMNT_0017876437 /DNA_START=388 /DNA_END=2514 /DNA_ORIENTATION=-